MSTQAERASARGRCRASSAVERTVHLPRQAVSCRVVDLRDAECVRALNADQHLQVGSTPSTRRAGRRWAVEITCKDSLVLDLLGCAIDRGSKRTRAEFESRAASPQAMLADPVASWQRRINQLWRCQPDAGIGRNRLRRSVQAQVPFVRQTGISTPETLTSVSCELRRSGPGTSSVRLERRRAQRAALPGQAFRVCTARALVHQLLRDVQGSSNDRSRQDLDGSCRRTPLAFRIVTRACGLRDTTMLADRKPKMAVIRKVVGPVTNSTTGAGPSTDFVASRSQANCPRAMGANPRSHAVFGPRPIRYYW